MEPKIICPACGKQLSVETNEEACPKSFYKDGKHPIFVVNMPEWSIPVEVSRL
jgi:hypothetical protein